MKDIDVEAKGEATFELTGIFVISTLSTAGEALSLVEFWPGFLRSEKRKKLYVFKSFEIEKIESFEQVQRNAAFENKNPRVHESYAAL